MLKALRGCLVTAAALAPLLALPATAKVGVASVVNGEPVSKPPTESERVLHIGNDMKAEEAVTTKGNDRAHIVFLDGSTLTIGPNSSIVIDKFVFDPTHRNGTLNIRATRGVLRYVGGAISKNDEVSIKTPSATIGIRGGIATVSVEPSGATRANFLFGGSLSITSQGVTQTTTQPSTQIAVTNGLPPTPPAPIPPGMLQQTTRALQATQGTSGQPGAPAAAAISSAFSGASFSQVNSGMAPAAARAAIPTAQQAQMGVGKALAATPAPGGTQAAAAPGGAPAAAGSTPGGSQAGGTVQQAGPQQGAGPLQTSGPLQGNSPLQANGPLQSSGPLQAAGPTQGTGSLQNAGPLAAASPFQQNGPVGTDGALNINGTQPGLAPPNAAGPAAAALAGGLMTGDAGAMRQLQNLLGSPQGTSPATLGTLVSNLVSTAAATPAAPAAAAATGGGFAAAPAATLVPLAPAVYNNTPVAAVSPN